MTDAARSYRSRARVVHRAPPPRAPRASQNPAERFAAKKRRATLANPTWCARKPAGCYWCVPLAFRFDIKGAGEHPSTGEVTRTAGHQPRPRVSSRETPRIRASRTSASSTAGAHAPTTSQGSRLPPPRVEFTQSSSRRVELDARSARRLASSRDRFANRGRSRVSPGALSAGRHALTPLPISTPSTSSLTPACPSQPCPENINCSWVRHARKRRGAVRGGPL